MLDLLDVDLVLGEQHPLGLGQVVVDEPLDAEGDGGREEQRLPLRRHVLHDLAHLDREAHVEHAVGLVEDEHLHLLEAQGLAPQVVEDAARGAHDDVGAGADAFELAVHRVAAVDRLDLRRPWPCRSRASSSRDLDGQLARGGQGHRLDGRQRGVDLLDHRDAEGRRLAGPGAGLHDEVLAGQRAGDGLELDVRGGLVAHGVQAGQGLGGEVE